MRLPLAFLLGATSLCAQTHTTNVDERKVPAYTLPALAVGEAKDWPRQRAALLAQFAHHVHGRTPATPGKIRVRVDGERDDCLGGLAHRTLLHIDLPELPGWHGMDVLLYVPQQAKAPVPCFFGLNFAGNQSVTDESDVPSTVAWLEDGPNVLAHHALPTSAGADASSWPLRTVVAHGFAIATVHYGDLEPDHKDGWRDGVRGAFAAKDATTHEGDAAWGAVGAWAFGLSRLVDHLVTDPRLDPARLAVVGHSRLGKAALWAGVQDERIALVIANESGEGGAALMRRDFGETIGDLVHNFPHWFCPRFAEYANAPERCPVDAHQLLALCAPRLLYVASARDDWWCDPRGEFLAAQHASAAWEPFGKRGLPAGDWPANHVRIGNEVGYHVRPGEHGLTPADWRHFLDFAELHWSQKH
ncbi:MAG: acetylxylan esterase [Planctomycetes bacterium]|nr:acetylxylan esterase [Planctomycetota bacterium]